MRLAILSSIIALSLALGLVRADDSFIKIMIDGHVGYIVPAEYCQPPDSFFRNQVAGLLLGNQLVGNQYMQMTFWTPTIDQATEAERAVKKFIATGIKMPKAVFPYVAAHPDKFPPKALQNSRDELALVVGSFDKYTRQFVGISFKGKRLIYCNYFDFGPAPAFPRDPSNMFIVTNDGGHYYWQVEYDIDSKTCTNLEINGPWASDR